MALPDRSPLSDPALRAEKPAEAARPTRGRTVSRDSTPHAVEPAGGVAGAADEAAGRARSTTDDALSAPQSPFGNAIKATVENWPAGTDESTPVPAAAARAEPVSAEAATSTGSPPLASSNGANEPSQSGANDVAASDTSTTGPTGMPAGEPASATTPGASGMLALLFGIGLFALIRNREHPPTVSISIDDPILSAGEQGTLRLVFDRPPKDFGIEDIEVSGGSLSALRATSDPTVFLATITPAAGLQARADGGAEILVTVKGGSYTDAQGRPGRAGSLAIDADTVAPRAAMFGSEQGITAGGRAHIDLVFSEAIAGLSIEDLIASGGRVETLTVSATNAQGAPLAYRVIFVADSTDFDAGAASLRLRAGSYTDLAGNPGSGASTAIDVRAPRLLSIIADDARDTVTLTYDLGLRGGAGAPLLSQFELIQGGQFLPVGSITVEDRSVILSVPGLSAGAFSMRYTDTGPSDGEAVIQSLSGIDADSFFRGLVADGYIQGARIYLDNGDGVFEPGVDLDTGVVTARDGSFVLGPDAIAELAAGRSLIAVGGINTDTRVPNTMTMAAPAGASVINPLTTMMQALIAAGEASDPRQAQMLIARAFDLEIPEAGLANFDPIAAAEWGTTSQAEAGLAAQRVAAKIAMLLTLAQTQQADADAGEAAEQALLAALTEAIGDRAAALAAGGDNGGINAPQPLNLADRETLEVLDARAETLAVSGKRLGSARPISIEWSDEAIETLGDIRLAADLATIRAEQSSLLDVYAPAAPVLKTLLPSMNGLQERLVIELPRIRNQADDLHEGDRVDIIDAAGTVIISHALSADEINEGVLRLAVGSNFPALEQLSLRITDHQDNATAGATRSLSTLPAQEGAVFDLGAALLPFIQSALQCIANLEIPFVGSIGGVLDTQRVSLWLDRVMSDLPELTLRRGQSGPVLKSGTDSGFYFGFDDGSSDWDWSDAPFDNDSFIIDPRFDDGGGFIVDPGSSDSGFIFGPEGADDGGFTNPDASGGSTDNNGVNWGPIDWSAAREYRFTGPQFNLPERVQSFSYDAVTGAFELLIIDPEPWFNTGFGGRIDGSGGSAYIDANLSGHRVLEVRLHGNIRYEMDAMTMATLDPEKSSIRLHADLGVAPGSTLGGSLGPFWLEAQDRRSSYAGADALRRNTGVEGGVTVSFKDIDGVNDNKLSLIKGADTLIGMLRADPLSALGEAINWSSNFQGQLSAQGAIGLNPGALISDPQWAGVADLFSLRLDSTVTAPFRVAYDSRDASKSVSNYGTVHFDNVGLSLAPLIHQAAGSAVSMVDTVMSPLYAIENFFAYELPLPSGLQTSPIAAPSLPGWMPGFAKDFIANIVTAPKLAINNVMRGITRAIDVDGNGQVTVLELIEQTARYYFEFVKFTEKLWDTMVQLTPGLKDTLKATPYGSTLVAVLDSFAEQKAFFEAFFDYFGDFKHAMQIIDQIEQLSSLHQAAVAELTTAQSGEVRVASLGLGSFRWDIPQGSFQSVENSDKNIRFIDRVEPVDPDPEPGLTQEAAFARLKAYRFDARATPDQYPLHGGPGSLNEYVYAKAGITGVTNANVDAINSLLIDGRLAPSLLQWGLGSTPSKVPPDDHQLQRGIQTGVDAYDRIQRVAKGQGSAADLAGLLEAFEAVGIINRSSAGFGFFDSPRYDNVPIDGVYTDPKARALLTDLVRAQSPQDLDSSAELAQFAQAWAAWLRLNGHNNRNFQGPAEDLSLEQFQTLGLSFLTPEVQLKAINDEIRSYSGDSATFFSAISKRVEAINAAWIAEQESKAGNGSTGQTLVGAISKIRDAAETDTARATLTLDDFARAGVSGLTAKTLPGFVSFLDSPVIGRAETLGTSEIQKLVNYHALLLQSAGTKVDSTSALPFYVAIDGLLRSGRAAEMEHIPFANASISRSAGLRTASLPLLQSIVANLKPSQVDEYAELDAIFEAAREMLKASMSNEKLWLREGLEKHEPWKSNAQALDQAIANYKGYNTTLTVDQLKLIGFPDATEATLARVKETLADYAARSYKTLQTSIYVGSGRGTYSKTFEYYEPKAPSAEKLLKITDLGATVAPPNDQIAALLESMPNVKAFWEALKAAGVEFPILEQLNGDLAQALWNNDLIEFMRFTPSLPTIDIELPFSYNVAQLLPFYDQVNAVLPFSLPVEFKGEFSLIPRLSIGADNYWLQSIRAQEGRPIAEILGNSIYLIDDYDIDGVRYDLPELEIDLSLIGSVGAILGKQNGLANLYARLFGGVDLSIDFDLIGDSSGKLRLADMLDTLGDFAGSANVLERLADNLFDVINVSGSLDLTLGGEMGLHVDLTPADRSDLGAITAALISAYETAASWLDLETQFDWSVNPKLTVPVFSFDTASGSWLLNV